MTRHPAGSSHPPPDAACEVSVPDPERTEGPERFHRREQARGGQSFDDEVYRLVERSDIAGAVRLVMLRHGPSVQKFCRVTLRDPVLADDVCQQIFFDVFRDLPTFQARSTIRTWLFGIARHRILDAMKMRRRAQARILPAELGDHLADEPDPGPSPAETVDATRLQEALQASLGDLSESARISVLLRYLQGLTFDEIARICGDTPGTHHARVTRALRRLRAGIESRIGTPALLPIRSMN
jgi:RNA polymerase sigma-70 factor (ECF subfamily)